jgi:hypothetical protein
MLVLVVVVGYSMILMPIIVVILFLLLLFIASEWKINVITTTAIILTCISVICAVSYWSNNVL